MTRACLAHQILFSNKLSSRLTRYLNTEAESAANVTGNYFPKLRQSEPEFILILIFARPLTRGYFIYLLIRSGATFAIINLKRSKNSPLWRLLLYRPSTRKPFSFAVKRDKILDYQANFQKASFRLNLELIWIYNRIDFLPSYILLSKRYAKN